MLTKEQQERKERIEKRRDALYPEPHKEFKGHEIKERFMEIRELIKLASSEYIEDFAYAKQYIYSKDAEDQRYARGLCFGLNKLSTLLFYLEDLLGVKTNQKRISGHPDFKDDLRQNYLKNREDWLNGSDDWNPPPWKIHEMLFKLVESDPIRNQEESLRNIFNIYIANKNMDIDRHYKNFNSFKTAFKIYISNLKDSEE